MLQHSLKIPTGVLGTALVLLGILLPYFNQDVTVGGGFALLFQTKIINCFYTQQQCDIIFGILD